MVRPKRVAFRTRNGVGTRGLAFAAQWLAYALPYRRFVAVLTDANARLGADVDRYSFIVVDLHHLLLAGLPAHFESNHLSQPVGVSATKCKEGSNGASPRRFADMLSLRVRKLAAIRSLSPRPIFGVAFLMEPAALRSAADRAPKNACQAPEAYPGFNPGHGVAPPQHSACFAGITRSRPNVA
jgi:hypothetical protein